MNAKSNIFGTLSTFINVGTGYFDLFDCVSNSFLRKNISGNTHFVISGNSAVVLVLIVSNANIIYRDGRMWADEIVVDYNLNQPPFETYEEVTTSEYRMVRDLNGDCLLEGIVF